MTAYALMLHSTGLSIREAAKLHKVPAQTVRSWLSGAADAPEAAIKYLYAVIDLQHHAAEWVIADIQKHNPQGPIKVCVTDDEHESGTLGWPTPSLMNGAVRRFIEMADPNIRGRTVIVNNPVGEERNYIYFFSVRLKEDGTFAELPSQEKTP